jgi:hypothetical protein
MRAFVTKAYWLSDKIQRDLRPVVQYRAERHEQDRQYRNDYHDIDYAIRSRCTAFGILKLISFWISRHFFRTFSRALDCGSWRNGARGIMHRISNGQRFMQAQKSV